MNELAREAVRERIGEERIYATDFGERSFGIGDVLVGRERAHGGVNGDLYTLAGHRDDGRLELVRLRDEKRAVWDLHAYTSIARSTTAMRRRRIGRRGGRSIASTRWHRPRKPGGGSMLM